MTESDNNRFNTDIFASQIVKLKTLLSEFSDILQSESMAIASGKAESLEAVTQQKQSLATQIEDLSSSVDQLLQPLDINVFSLTEHSLFTTLDSNTQQQLLTILELIQRCHDQNLANGMAIQTLSNINLHALNILSGESEKDVKLYSASGNKTSSKSGKTLGKA